MNVADIPDDKSGRLNQQKKSPRDRKNRRRRRPPRQRQSPQQNVKKEKPKTYDVVFYESLHQAKNDMETLAAKAKDVDQLNIVIHAESPMDDPDLLQFGIIYAGEAWTTIHKRRVEEGWYQEPH